MSSYWLVKAATNLRTDNAPISQLWSLEEVTSSIALYKQISI